MNPRNRQLLNPPEAMESKALEALGQRALANPSDRALWNRWVKAEERKTLANAFGPLPELEDWPEDPVPLNSMRTAWHYRTKEPLPEVVIALLPLAHPWDAFAHLQFGGWNDCPYSAEHVAWWRYWYEQHNAVVLGVTTDTVEAYVHNPPTTREEAARLAYQQYAYCSDIVNQGVGSIEDLAANLLQRETWHFWWD